MRKSDAETVETRKRIIELAAREFQRKGISATRVDDVMEAAGLTRGGFYRHFESKEDLFSQSFDLAMSRYTDLIREKGKSSDGGIDAIAAYYLSTSHRDDPASGCPIAALGGELRHFDQNFRARFSKGFEDFVSALAEQLGEHGDERRRVALSAFSMMLGAITLSRFVGDEAISEEILEACKIHMRSGLAV